ncbi:MAG: TonB family protein [Saprospiraceae bacterium]|nr:TonB family protein [Saprospiraceae bacterium]
MLNYVLEVNICWLGFYLLYGLVLSRETFFEYNRWYLLAGLVGGLVIPLVEYQIIVEQIIEIPSMSLDLEGLSGMTATAVAADEPSVREMLLKGLFVVYLLGVAILAVRFMMGLLRIGWLYWRGTKMERPGYALVKTPSVHPPFSFFHWLFQSQRIPLDEADEEKIITHEIEHIRQWHSLDVLLVELIGIVLWFSPLVWLYRRSLRMIHEYQADEAVLQTTKRKSYGHLLIRQSMSGPPIAIANHFIHSQLKKRLTMMTKKKSTQRSLMKYTFILPVLALMLMAFAPTKVYKMVTVETPTEVPAVEENNPGPDLDKIKKELSLILAKRAHSKENIDGKLAGLFAKKYDSYVQAYPDHKKDITKVAVLVADYYEMDTTVEDDQMVRGQFRNAFTPKKESLVIEDTPGSGVRIRSTNGDQFDPLYIIDGKVATKAEMETLNPDGIERIDVLKGESATALYGESGENGVVKITLKKDGEAIEKIHDEKGNFFQLKGEIEKVDKIDASETTIQIIKEEPLSIEDEMNKPAQSTIKIRGTASSTEKPLFVVNDEILDNSLNDPMTELNPDDIEFINVLKGTAAHDKYGEKGANGVVEIYTKGFEKKEETDVMPRFGDCDEQPNAGLRNACSKKALLNYIISNMQYPKSAKEAGIEGKVIVSFMVKKNGMVAAPKVVGGSSNSALQKEAVRMVKSMPKWIPGKKGGKAVDVEMKLPFTFDLGAAAAPMQVVDQMPLFPGVNPTAGTAAERKAQSDQRMLEYIYSNLKYPKEAREAGAEGTVHLSFTVTEKGLMEDLKIVKAPFAALGKSAYIALNSLEGTWTPGMNKGKAVATELTIPIKFRFDKEPAAETPNTKLPSSAAALELGNFKLTPNPNNGEMLVNFQSTASPVLIQVFDVNGQEVYKEYLPNFAGSYRETIRLDKVAKGSHVLSIIQDNKRFTRKFVTQ